jgi:hypothetical protein
MGIINFVLSKLFSNFCLHGLQKLNYYNCVFKNYLQVLKICGSLKNKVKVFESR